MRCRYLHFITDALTLTYSVQRGIPAGGQGLSFPEKATIIDQELAPRAPAVQHVTNRQFNCAILTVFWELGFLHKSLPCESEWK